jgi:flagellar hook-associated protein 1 FlgK
MRGGGTLGIGISALQAYQRALQVTGHNIANVGTEGYSRQQLQLGTQQPMNTGFGSLGTGVATMGVRRVVDEFVEMRLGMNASAEGYERTYAEFARQLDSLLGDPAVGLSPALSRFFGAIEDVSTDPTSTAARQQLITEAQALADRFAQLEGRIDDQRSIANGRISNTVGEINQLAGSIARLNREIVEARGGNGGNNPNDLLDQRDTLIRELSERISVKTLAQSDGSVNVYVGRGQSLVVGFEQTQLFAQALGSDPERLDIGFRNGSAMVVATEFLSGGQLGALLELRNTLFDPASNALGRIAISLADRFNEIHTAGMDLRGLAGEAFFSLPPPSVLANRSNTATGRPELTINDIGGLRSSDYQLRFDGDNWILNRLSDNQRLATLAPGDSLEFDGLVLDTSSVGTAQRGDTFLLRPLRVAADLEVRITDPRAIAAALPVRAEAVAGNLGTASLRDLAITDAGNGALRSPVDIQFSGGEFVVNGIGIAPDPSGDTLIEANGWRVLIRGTPAEGDSFVVRDNTGGIGDNRGALALAQLSNRRELSGGSATLAESYAELVADIGVKTRRATINADVQSRLLAESKAQRESISGVNLDEEAANLLRFQQAYQASAQLIAVTGSLFDTLLNAVRR